MQESRKISIILFADIAGYTALMANDETFALGLLQQFQDALEQTVPHHKGEIIQYFGDGCLLSFKSAQEAVECAMALQTSFTQAEIPVRIGMDLGDVVFKDGNVFGDGVNTASRIESMGVPGAILLSGSIRNQIKNKSEFTLTSLGSFDFKNVEHPIEVFALANEGFIVPKRSELKGKFKETKKQQKKTIAAILIGAVILLVVGWCGLGQEEKAEIVENSIAVLPFVNMSSDPEQEYFSDGISEEIINMLAQVPNLKVIGRTSSFAFKGKNMDLKVIGEQLNVEYLLEGSVRKSGNELRITAQLIKVSDGFHLYSKTYKEQLVDVFAIQDKISLDILDEIKLKLLGPAKEAVLKKYTDNVEAHELYLKGRFHMNKFTPEGFTEAIKYYDEAIALDSNYSLAYADKAFCLMSLKDLFWFPVEDSIVRQCAQRALELDDQSAQSYLAIGRIQLHWNWDVISAKKAFEKSIQINPNNAECHVQLGFCAALLGNNREALIHADMANNFEPFSLLNLWYAAVIPWAIGDGEKLLEYANNLIAVEPGFYGGYEWAGEANLFLDNYDEAIASIEKIGEVEPDSELGMASRLSKAYGMSGDTTSAKGQIAVIKSYGVHEMALEQILGMAYLSIGELDSAFLYFHQAIDRHDNLMLWGKNAIQPILAKAKYAHMASDPRFEEFWARIKPLE